MKKILYFLYQKAYKSLMFSLRKTLKTMERDLAKRSEAAA